MKIGSLRTFGVNSTGTTRALRLKQPFERLLSASLGVYNDLHIYRMFFSKQKNLRFFLSTCKKLMTKYLEPDGAQPFVNVFVPIGWWTKPENTGQGFEISKHPLTTGCPEFQDKCSAHVGCLTFQKPLWIDHWQWLILRLLSSHRTGTHTLSNTFTNGLYIFRDSGFIIDV